MLKDLCLQLDELNNELKKIEQMKEDYESHFNDYTQLKNLIHQIDYKLNLVSQYFESKKPRKTWDKLKLYNYFESRETILDESQKLRSKKESIQEKTSFYKIQLDTLQKEIEKQIDIKKQINDINEQIEAVLMKNNHIDYRIIHAHLSEIHQKREFVDRLLEKGKHIKRDLMYLKGQLEYLQSSQRYDQGIGEIVELLNSLESDIQKGKVKKLIQEFNNDITTLSKDMVVYYKPIREIYFDFDDFLVNLFQKKRTDQNIQKVTIASWNFDDAIKKLQIMSDELNKEEERYLTKRTKIINELLSH